MNAKIVLDLTFGDSGKGLMVDNLCKGKETLVVRFSGGQQVGHTVVADGFRHVFSNLGAGTLRGSHTYYTEDTTMYLNTLFRELFLFKQAGKFNMGFRQYYHPLSMVTTPFDVIVNRIKENRLKHGSCGLGIGETMKRNTTPYKFYVQDLINPVIFEQKLKSVKDYFEDVMYVNGILRCGGQDLHTELEDFYRYVEKFREYHKQGLFQIKTIHDIPDIYSNLVFEGSQGIMLDMDHGIFPNVTYANTTCKNALKFISKSRYNIDEIETYYVTRCYQTRHGNGWMPNEDLIVLENNAKETNVQNEWQGEFRTGELDVDLLKHAISCDESYHDILPDMIFSKNIVLTCLDQRPEFDYEGFKNQFVNDLRGFEFFGNYGPERGCVKSI